jgi:spermidine dehydrogenase
MTSGPNPDTEPPGDESNDEALGLDQPIARRDFVAGALAGTGAALFPTRGQPNPGPPANPDWTGYAGTGDYASSNGNTWDVVQAGHGFRDGRYAAGIRAASDTGERYDLIVIGGGVSGLAAAFYFQRMRGGRCLVLDNHPIVGGEAKRNEFEVDGIRLIAPQGSNGFGTGPIRQGPQGEFWREIGLPQGDDPFEFQAWAPGAKPLPMTRDHYFHHLWTDEFSSHGFFFPTNDGSLRLVRDAFGAGLSETPWSDALRRDFVRWRTDPRRYYQGEDASRWLDGMTYENLITKVMGLDVAVARYVDPICAAAIGLGSDTLSANAAAAISLPGTTVYSGRVRSHRLADRWPGSQAFPGGNDAIVRHTLKTLVPDAIEGPREFAAVLANRFRPGALDQPANPTRVRLGATVVRVEDRSDRTVAVTYRVGQRFHRVRGAAVVMANGAWSSRYLVADLPASHRDALAEMVRAPMLVVNVALRRWRFMYDLGITAASYRDRLGFSCNIRQSMIAGDYRPPLDPDAPNVLTFYVSFPEPGRPVRDQVVAARTKLLATSYRTYERLIREQMVRLFGRAGFDPRSDIAGIVLNRWGHAYVCPEPGFYFGRQGRPAARDVLRQGHGRVVFANADLYGHQNWIAATAEARRAVEQVLRAG